MPLALQGPAPAPAAGPEVRAVPAPNAAPAINPVPRDFRSFVEARRDRIAAVEVAYDVSQALEECYAVSMAITNRPSIKPVSSKQSWAALAASEALATPCMGFEGHRIRPDDVLSLLRYAADGGEPRARARLLLMRDVAAPKDAVIEEIPALLASRDAGIVRDVGAFLARGEIDVRLGSDVVPAPIAAIAWELAACELGFACGPDSRLALAQCAFAQACTGGSYEQALETMETPEAMTLARDLRTGIVRALRDFDWAWLGLIAPR